MILPHILEAAAAAMRLSVITQTKRLLLQIMLKRLISLKLCVTPT